MTEQDARPNMSLPVLVQPEPNPDGRVGPWRLAVAGVAAVVIVTIVLYGISRPPEPAQMAAAAQAPQQAEAASNGQRAGGSGQNQAAKPHNAQPGKPPPSTTGASTTGASPTDQGQQPKQAPAAS
jgi:hypothetical protein